MWEVKFITLIIYLQIHLQIPGENQLLKMLPAYPLPPQLDFANELERFLPKYQASKFNLAILQKKAHS